MTRANDPGWMSEEPIHLDGQEQRDDYGRLLSKQKDIVMVIASRHELVKWWPKVFSRCQWKYCRYATLNTFRVNQGEARTSGRITPPTNS